MFTVIEEIGPASWLSRNESHEEVTSSEILRTYQYGECFTKSVPELKIMIEGARECGKTFFKMGDIYYARLMFEHAFMISKLIHQFPKDQSSIFNSNAALCSLKLEEPVRALMALTPALVDDMDNVKANYHVIASVYMMYRFEEAMILVTSGLSAHPELKELQLMKEKILRNKIPEKFSTKIIEQRIAKYSEVLRLIDTQHRPSDLNFVNVELLKQHIQANRKSASLKEAHRVMAKMEYAAETLIYLKNYSSANQMLIDMLYVINVLEKQFNERVDDKMYHIYSNKAICLYYMENYREARDCCNKAKTYNPDALKLLTVEAKILNKLNNFDEALEAINKCIRIVDPNSVEAVICEEILFEINFKRDMQTHSASKPSEASNVTSGHSTGNEKQTQDDTKFQDFSDGKATQSKENSSVSEDKEEQAPEQDEYLMMICRLCGTLVRTPWSEHVWTDEHQTLLSGKKQKVLLIRSTQADVSTQADRSENPN